MQNSHTCHLQVAKEAENPAAAFEPTPGSAVGAAIAELSAVDPEDFDLGRWQVEQAQGLADRGRRTIVYAPGDSTGSCKAGIIRMPPPSRLRWRELPLATAWALTLLHECVHSAAFDMPGARWVFPRLYFASLAPLLLVLCGVVTGLICLLDSPLLAPLSPALRAAGTIACLGAWVAAV